MLELEELRDAQHGARSKLAVPADAIADLIVWLVCIVLSSPSLDLASDHDSLGVLAGWPLQCPEDEDTILEEKGFEIGRRRGGGFAVSRRSKNGACL